MRLWVVREDWNLSQATGYPDFTGRVVNALEIFDATMRFNGSLAGDAPWPAAFPPDFPVPRVAFSKNRLPDFNVTNNLVFVSERLRQAMALPEAVAEFIPIQNVSRMPVARDVLYWLLHVTAFTHAIDGERSDCHVEPGVSAKTGAQYVNYAGLTGIRVRPDFTPPADLFHDAVASTILFATDALAQRVLEAGCTGVEFRHPLWFSPGFDHVLKTLDGIVRVGTDTRGHEYDMGPITLEQADQGPTPLVD